MYLCTALSLVSYGSVAKWLLSMFTTYSYKLCSTLQVRLILELEDTMSVLRYYARNTKLTFTRDQSWYSVIWGGKNELERKEAQLVAWERKASFEKVQELLVRLNTLPLAIYGDIVCIYY